MSKRWSASRATRSSVSWSRHDLRRSPSEPVVLAATNFSQQFEPLTGDSLIVAVMRHHGLTNLASEDADFDRVAGLTRYAPV
ncbi:MAG TPA: PIN domain-containing protein [Gemmataceae bacterium]|nr:PIN domain-containing protein [Gemmataceae bacterium]